MKSSEDRVLALHEKMKQRRQKKERRRTEILGACSCVLTACLFLVIFGSGVAQGGGTAMYSGSALLFENVGGHVLVAIISFAAAVIITVACLRWRENEKNRTNPEK